ncbi:MAG: hypothetical protein JWO72_2369, partial [Caulobacteraceae bacterium]|nr:hypothetical protein [Caulobacteraceae bacterium]
QTSAPLSVLTNERVVQAPVEIRPPDRPSSPLRTTVPAVPAVPLPGGAGSASPPGAPAGGAAKPFEGRIVGFDDHGVRTGLRMRLGCVSPDTYHLTPEERAECLRRLADEAKTAQAMGPNIPAAKQAEYDRSVACRSSARAGSIPGSSADSSGSIRGLGASPRLRDCGPGDW